MLLLVADHSCLRLVRLRLLKHRYFHYVNLALVFVHVSAEFDNIDGVAVGSDVRVAGIKIGTVTGQSLNPKSYQARIDMVINPGIVLAEDTSAKVTSEGLLGSKFVALEPGGADTKLAEGSVISYTQGAVDIWSLISQAMFSKTKTPEGTTAPVPDAPKQ